MRRTILSVTGLGLAALAFAQEPKVEVKLAPKDVTPKVEPKSGVRLEPRPEPKPDPAARDIKDAIDVFTDTINRKAPDAIGKHVTADFTWVTDGGELLDLKAYSDTVKGGRAIALTAFNGNPDPVDEIGASYQSVRVLTGSAVAVGTWVITTKSGKTWRTRFTIVCAKTDEGWKVVSAQHSQPR